MFTRFIMFEELMQMRVVQDHDERVLSVELRTDKGAVLLTGYEGMERLFTSLVQRKPKNVVVELEESRVDWSNPLNVFYAMLPLALLVLLPPLFMEVSEQLYWFCASALFSVTGLLFLAARPFSRGRSVAALRREMAVGLVFLGLGLLILFR